MHYCVPEDSGVGSDVALYCHPGTLLNVQMSSPTLRFRFSGAGLALGL